MPNTLLKAAVAVGVCLAGAGAQSVNSDNARQDWTNYVRIGAYSLNGADAEKIVSSAEADHVAGIEVDNDIPGRYESFLDPTEKLKALRAMAASAHKAGNYAFVYIAGTECITAKAASQTRTMAKDHPDWVQRKI